VGKQEFLPGTGPCDSRASKRRHSQSFAFRRVRNPRAHEWVASGRIERLRWYALDLDAGTVSVVRAARHREKTKTKQSVRSLELASRAIAALKVWREIQIKEFAAFGGRVTESTPVFTRPDGTAYTERTARTQFRNVLKAAKIADPDAWSLRETRTTFVSVMSHNGVAREMIADMCGHSVRTLEKHYRKVLRPVHRHSADVINRVFAA